jgi:DNA-binding NarL/FixJ family response regulator
MEPQPAVTDTDAARPSSSPPPTWLRVVPEAGRFDALSEQARAALATVRLAGEACDPAELWELLCAGRLHVCELAADERHAIALLEERSANDATGHAIAGRRREILERVLEGQSLSFVALDLGMANSTVSAEFKRSATTLGLGRRIAELPVLIAQLWFAKKPHARVKAHSCHLHLGCQQLRVLALPRADLKPLLRLSRAEAEVCRLLLEGRSHAEISAARETRPRTTANQISSIFRKFGVSGRLELLTQLAREAVAPNLEMSA